jgi:hypothetical protein
MTLRHGICPTCGSKEVFTKPAGVKGHNAGVYIQTGMLGSVQLDAYVCIGCGHTELSVPAHSLEQVREAINTRGWTRVEVR